MSNPILLKNFTAFGAIAARRLVKFNAAGVVTVAAAATDAIIGVTDDVGPANGERVDIVVKGIAWVEAGAATSLGDPITSDSVGRGVTAAPAAGVNNRIIGVGFDAAGAAGDLIRVLLSPGILQG